MLYMKEEGYTGYVVKAPAPFSAGVVLDQLACDTRNLEIISSLIRNTESGWGKEAA